MKRYLMGVSRLSFIPKTTESALVVPHGIRLSSEARSHASEASKPPAGARISRGPKNPEILV